MTGTIDYGNLMHRAMRGLIQEVLEDVAADGLPGEHHFFITLDTQHADVEMADWLADRFPEEMTIVVQHWFDNLNVTDDGFAITLNFGDNPEPLYIPYDAIKTFVDPSVEFGLRFESQEQDAAAADPAQIKPTADNDKGDQTKAPADAARDEPHDADIVSLDSFRK